MMNPSFLNDSSRNFITNELIGIDEVHLAYRSLAMKISQVAGGKIHLIDDSFSTYVHYISFDRNRIDLFLEAILELDCYFSIKTQGGKETYFNKDSFSINGLSYFEINSLKVYKKIYYQNKQLVFGARVALIIDFWRKNEGVYHANTFNPIVTEISEDKLKSSFQTVSINQETISILSSYAEIREALKDDPIDIVYTWVDSSDREWGERKKKALTEKKASISSQLVTDDPNDPVRFANNNELLYSLRSISTYFKNINKIYIITDNQQPDFLDLNNEDIIVIDHKDIFKDTSNLPTFNSHAIESQIHHIQGLSNKYIYFNDDILLGRVVTRKLFFDEYCRAKCFYSNTVAIPPTENTPTYSLVNNAAINNKALLKKEYGIVVTRKFKHTPVAVLRELMSEMEVTFTEAFARTASSVIRNPNDYSIAGSLYYHFGLIKGKIYPSDLQYTYLDLGSPKVNIKISKMLEPKESKRFDIICVNSTTHTESYDINVRFLNTTLCQLFPVKSKYEK